MRVLLVGSGGREHALGWALAASPLIEHLIIAPGNAGMGELGEIAPVGAEDIPGLVALAQEKDIDFVVVGPEAPLCAGLVDALGAAGIKAFGPNAAAARLEGSKAYMKDLAARAGVPTAQFRRFEEIAAAKAYVKDRGLPIVIKTDGLAAGKGVTVATTLAEAEQAIAAALSGEAFGAAGQTIVIEDFLEGEEASFFVLCDGKTLLPLIAAQDHKQAYNGDQGPNTGGMGAFSPTPVFTPEIEARVLADIIQPVVDLMAAEGAPYKGVLFAGLMIGEDGPKLIEFNVRFGDPECQVLMSLLRSDLLPALLASAEGNLDQVTLRWRKEQALCVVLAAKGYPGDYRKGTVIKGLEKAAEGEGVMIFHAGTRKGAGGEILANGGRVLNVVGRAETLQEARARAYKAVDMIDWPDGFCRRDIAWRALKD